VLTRFADDFRPAAEDDVDAEAVVGWKVGLVGEEEAEVRDTDAAGAGVGAEGIL
jgi:hypothetical protein